MSANKSWDIRPNTKKQVRITADSALVRGGKKPVASVPLRARRQKQRKVWLIVVLICIALLVGASIWTLWQPALRVQIINTNGEHGDEMKALASEALAGTYYYVLPKNSTLVVPKEDIRSRILGAHPDLSAVSVKRSGFDSILISSVARDAAFIWCGTSIVTEAPGDGLCYEADAAGFLFATIYPPEPVSSTTPVSVADGRLSIYAPLTEPTTPLGAHVANAEIIPDVLLLQRSLASLGASVEKIQVRGDEADFYTTGGTRITYVLGDEDNAAALAASAFPNLNLNDGSIEYVDLRFSGKVYLKREGETESE